MAKVDYDQFAGLGRLAEAAASIDARAAVILTYHAALEREIDIVLDKLLPRYDRLPRRRFGYGHKIDILNMAWAGNTEAGDRLFQVLFRFNELRNAVAHGDRTELVDQKLAELLAAYRAIVPDADEDIQIDAVAAGICGFMADGPTPKELTDMFVGLEDLMNVVMPVTLGPRPEDDRSV